MNAETGLDRPHVFLPADEGAAGPPLLLLHGTGGNEHDLLPLREPSVARCGGALGTRHGPGERDAEVLPAS